MYTEGPSLPAGYPFDGFAELSRLWAGDPPRARRSMRDTGLRYMYLNILRGDCQKTVAHNALK